MSVLGTFIKQPGERRYYNVSFRDVLAFHGDTASPTTPVIAAPAPEGITLLATNWIEEDQAIRFWVDGGATGSKYKLTAWLNTVGELRLEADIVIVVKES